MKKLLVIVTVLLLIPSFANAWYVNAKTSPATGQGTITPAGNRSYEAGAASDEYTVAPAPGFGISRVTLDGVVIAPNASGNYVVPYLPSKSWRYLVAYFAAGKVSITTRVTGGSGAIREDSNESLTNIPLGSNRQLLVIPSPGYTVGPVTAPGATITDNSDGSKTVVYVNLQTSKTVSASFSLVPVLTVSAGQDVAAYGTGAEFAATLFGSATSNQGAVSYAWSGAGLSFGTPDAASTTVSAPTPGSYTATLTASSNGLVQQDSATVTVYNRSEYLTAICTSCHSMNTPQVTALYYASPHPGRTSCQDCHTTAPHTVRPTSSACVDCHADASGEVASHPLAIGGNPCLGCHQPHSTAAFAGAPTLHYNNMTGAGYPASFMPSRASCSDCHYGSSVNASIRSQWGASGHAAVLDLPWTLFDFKTQPGCVQCHTTTGFIAYSTGKVSSAWGVAADKTKEVLSCIGCHADVTTGALRTVAPVRPYAGDAYLNADVGSSNICMSCHSGVNNGSAISAQLATPADFGDLPFTPPHYLAAGGVLHGKGGYHLPGPSTYAFYSSNSHRTIGIGNAIGTGSAGPCIACHMSTPAKHLFQAVTADSSGTIETISSSACVRCHTASFDATKLEAARVRFVDSLVVLKAMLAKKGFVYTEHYPYFANTDWGTGPQGANTMGAAFNYVLLLKEPGAYAHNGDYSKRLIFDSIDYLYNGAITGSIEGALAELVSDGSITQELADSVSEYQDSNSCSSCHSNSSRSHPAHLIGGFGCQDCHRATALSNSALVPGSATHLNEAYDLEAGPGRSFSYSYAPTGGSCSSISCHNNGGAVWGGTLGCDSCHGNPPAYENSAQKANSHADHQFSCNVCHAGTTADGVTIANKGLHANGVANVTPGAGTSFSYAYAPQGGSCSNISCHGNTGATWGSTLGCATCHGNPPPNAAGNYSGVDEATSPHLKHAGTGANYGFACSQCHQGASHGTGTFQDVFINRDGILAGTGASYAAATRTCSATYCHSTGTSLATGNLVSSSVAWGSDKLACNACHGNPPAYGNQAPKTNSHASHNFTCNTCHAGTTADGSTITGTSRHVNGAYDVTPGAGTSFSYAYAPQGGSCSNISCHGNTGATWGSTLGCATCHGNPPPNAAGNYSGVDEASSPHLKHAGTGANYGFACSQCHQGASHGTGTFQDVFINRDGILAGPGASYTAATRTCSATYCHSTGTSLATGNLVSKSVAWGSDKLACDACHGNPPAYGNQAPKTNSHASHNFTCNTCHAGTTGDGFTISGTSRHVNGAYDVSPGAGTSFSYAYAPQGGSCSNISCHGNTGATWGSTLGCSTCHGNPPPNAAGNYSGVNEATSPHLKHAGTGANYSFACSQCHQGASHGTGTFQDVFINRDGILAGTGASYAAATRTCSATYCHSTGTSLATGTLVSSSVAWGSDKLACNACHGNPPAYANQAPKTNSHARHNFTCDTCHAGTTADGFTITGTSRHVNGAYDLTPGSGTTFSYAYAPDGGTCSNINCHQGFNAKWGRNPDHTATLTSASYYFVSDAHDDGARTMFEACATCHYADIVAQHNHDCSLCHTGANPPANALIGSWDKSCSSCHPSFHTAATTEHSAYVNLDDCEACHDGSWSVSCTFCHSPMQTLAGYIENNPPRVDTPPGVIKGNLKLLVHMDETAWNGYPNQVKDSSGWNSHGTSFNGANTVAGGISGRAGSFNGVNSSVVIKYAAGTQPMDNFTVEAWVKPAAPHEIDAESASGTAGVMGQKYLFWPEHGGDYDAGAGISVGTNGIAVYEHGSGYLPPLAVYSGAISSTEWSHIAVVYNNKRPSIYLNGALVRTGLQSARLHVHAPKTIGGETYGYYAGTVDETAVYDTALTGTEILQHAQQLCTATSNTALSVRWTSAIASSSYVDYGLTASYGATVGSAPLVTTHVVPLTGLAENTTYHYRVRSTNGEGVETVSADYSFTSNSCDAISEPPSAPTGISATGGGGMATVTWTAGTGSSSSLLRYGTSSGNLSTTIDPATSPQTITGLTNGVPIYYQVGAKNTVGTTWDSSIRSVTPAAPPSAPTAVAAVAGDRQATISWVAGTGSTSSLIRYGTSSANLSSVIDPAVSPHTITGLTNGTTIYYQVGAKNSVSTVWSTPVRSVTPLGPPAAPTGVAGASGNGQVTISWTVGAGSTSSLIRYGTTSTELSSVIDPALSPRTITGLVNGTTIYYQVGARNTVGTTWTSTVYSVTPLPPLPSPPTAVTALAGDAQATISWTPGTGSTSSVIRYGTISTNLSTSIDPATSPQTITGLVNGARIYYQVGAKNVAGTTWNSTVYNVTPVLSPPSAPTAVTALAGNAQATISWTPGTGSTSSLIRYGTTSTNLSTSIDPATSPQTITGLANGTTIYYQVGARNAAGTVWSAESSFTPIGPPSSTRTFQIAHYTGATDSGWVGDDVGDTMWAGPFDGYGVDRSFIMFDTSSLGPGTTVTSATLHLYFSDNSYLELNINTNIHESTWMSPGDGSTYDNVGALLAQSFISTSQAYGLIPFNIRADYINREGWTKFAIRANNEDYYQYWNADPGYSRANSYLEVTYSGN